MGRSERLAEVIYRRILARAPKEFVAEYGEEMTEAFLQRRRESGPLRRGWVTVRELFVLSRTCRTISSERGGVVNVWSDWLQDLQFGVRTLRRNPAYAGIAALTLALGIGGTAGIFSVVKGILLEPLPYTEPERLVRIYPSDLDRGIDRTAFSLPDFEDWQDGSRMAESMALYSVWPTSLSGEGAPVEIDLAFVTGDFFTTLGGTPAAGRLLVSADESEDDQVTVLSHGLWEQRFGSDPAVVGSVVTLGNRPFQVVGVAGPDFAFPSEGTEAWTLVSTIEQSSIPTERRFVRFASALARLAPNATPALLQDELGRIAAELESRFPESNGGIRDAVVEPLHESMVGNVATSLWLLMGAVAFILLIACVNVAALILTRASKRDAEMAVRSALGAQRGRLSRQLLAEGGVLAFLGAGLGVLAAHFGVGFFMDRSAGLLPRSTNVGVDPAVLLFTVGLVVLTAVVFGLAPALGASRVDISSTLREGGRDRGSTRRGRSLPRLLIAAEVALSMALLVGAALLIRSLGNLRDVDPGFTPESAVAITFTVPTERHPDIAQFAGQYLERVRALPGVSAAGTIRTLPLSGDGERWPFAVPGVLEPAQGEEPFSIVQPVTAGTFQALGVRLLSGRALDQRDRADAAPSVVVSRSLAETYFPGEDAVGRLLRVGGVQGRDVPIVGVVEDVRLTGLNEPAPPTTYVSLEFVQRAGMSVVVRTEPDVHPTTLFEPLRQSLLELDPDLPVSRVETLSQAVDASLARPRFFTMVLTLFSVVASTLAAVGVYGVISYHVGQRQSELGLRMALGARSGTVIRNAMEMGMTPAAIGTGLGLALAAVLSRTLGSLLYGVSTLDIWSYASVGAGSLAIALLACWIPARRAGKVDPAVALGSGG